MTFRLMIRGYRGRLLQFAQPAEVDSRDLARVGELAADHAGATVAGRIDMVEIEFLDEPDPAQRFFRIGVNRGMVMPIAVIVCPKCGMVSHNPNDIRERYCGNCHEFHEHMVRT